MKDYYVYSLDSVGGKVTDYPIALTLADVPWADKQMWRRTWLIKTENITSTFQLETREVF